MPVMPLPIPYALPHPAPVRDCTTAGGTEVIVCGRRASPRDRLPRLEPLPEPALPRAETAIPAGGRAAVEVQGKTLAPGMVSNRVMATLRWPF